MQRLQFVVVLTISLVVSFLLGLSCAPDTQLEISTTELDNRIMIKNVNSVDCIIFVNSPESEQHFELAVGQNTTVNGISQPIEISADSQ